MAERSSPSERLYTSLRADILHGQFAPEQALKPQELADAGRVSLAVARETLLRLVGEGLATRLPNRGFTVPAVDAQRWQQVAEARALTEPAMLRLSIERAGVDWEVRVRAAHHTLARTPFGDPDGWSEAHRCFHRALLDGCANPVLLEGFDRLWNASELARRWSGTLLPERASQESRAIEEHAALEDAALSRDADRATDLLARHILHTARILNGAD
jgi:DNA-binding GntR family transcriptional regulator